MLVKYVVIPGANKPTLECFSFVKSSFMHQPYMVDSSTIETFISYFHDQVSDERSFHLRIGLIFF